MKGKDKPSGEPRETARELADAFPEALCETGLDRIVTYANPAAMSTFGYTADEIAKGLDVLLSVVPEDRDAAMADLERIARGEDIGWVERVGLRRDGSRFPFAAVIQPIIKKKATVGLRIIAIDISRLKQTEDALRRAEEDKSLLLNTMSELVVRQDLEHRVLWANRAAEKSINSSLREMLGRRCYELWHGRTTPCENCAVVRAAATLRPEISEVTSPDGRHWVIRGYPILDPDGRLTNVMEITWDITDRKQAMDLLRESERKYKELYEYAPMPYITLDSAGCITDVNRKWQELMGYSKPDVLGTPVLDLVAPEERDSAAAAFEYRKTNRIIFAPGYERTFVTRAGSQRVFRVNDFLSTGPEGAILSVHRTMEDVTEQKKSSHDLLQANVLLSKALTELRRTQQQVVEQERLSALGQMASGIAHDFNNALMPIVGFSEFLMTNPATLDDREETLTILKDIRAAAQDARHSVQRLRCFYRPFDEGQLVPLNLNDIVESAIDLTQPRWKKEMGAKGAVIDIRHELQKLPLIKGSESQIREAITNILLNAMDAMPGGGTITVRTRPAGDFVVMDISDTGIGMSEEVRRQCFEPFFSTKGKGGTGMGLAVVFGIVKQLGGKIDVQSEPGKGTTFTFRMPIWQVSRDKMPAGVSLAQSIVDSLKILVIDDEERSRESIEMLLRPDHHQVELASSGAEGLRQFKDGSFDLVITDRAMPDMSGDFVAESIKAARPDIPVIMLTGFGELMKDAEDKPKGVDVIVSKPVTAFELKAAIAQAVRRS